MLPNEDSKLVLQFSLEHMDKMCKDARGVFPYPFLDPGAGYEDNLWDWDSYWSGRALLDIAACVDGAEERTAKVVRHIRGNVMNFLHLQHEDGFIPMSVTARGPFSTLLSDLHRQGTPVNQHKPFLCTQACLAAEADGDYASFHPFYNAFQKYLAFYDRNQFDAGCGLYFWRNDVMIGIDNNPAVFGRPDDSAADIYLNCFLYAELQSMARLAEGLGEPDDAKHYTRKAEALRESIRRECYDPRDGLYYSVDIQVHTHKTETFHHGLGAFWHTIPLKIRTWASFLPMFCGIATADEARIMVERHYRDKAFTCPFGVRTLSADERMYNTEASSNPSNWLGPVWIIANYCVFKGLLDYGFREETAGLAEKTQKLLAADIREHGCMSESYVPETGKPMLYGGFLNWNLLAVSMLRDLSVRMK